VVAARENTATEPPVSGATILVRVRYSDGSEGSGLAVCLRDSRGDVRIGGFRRSTDARGHCQFDLVPPGRWLAATTTASADRRAVVTVAANERVEIDLVIPVVLLLRGRVVDEFARSIANAELILGPVGVTDHDAGVVALTGDDGAFTVRTGLDPVLLGARAAGYCASSMRMVRGQDGAVHGDLVIALGKKGGSVQGIVHTPWGEPIPTATVQIGEGRLDALPFLDPAAAMPTQHVLPAQVWTDERGRFEAIGLASGLQPIAVRAPGWALWRGECLVTKGAVTEVKVVLHRGGEVFGRVATLAGEPVAGATIEIGSSGTLGRFEAVADANGSFRIVAVPPGSVRVSTANERCGKTATTVMVSEGGATECNLVLDGGRVLAGRAIPKDGDAIGFVQVLLWKIGEDRGTAGFVGKDGRFWFPNLPAGKFGVEFRGWGVSRTRFLGIDPDRPPGRGDRVPAAGEAIRNRAPSRRDRRRRERAARRRRDPGAAR
jgi:hypothetical protein